MKRGESRSAEMGKLKRRGTFRRRGSESVQKQLVSGVSNGRRSDLTHAERKRRWNSPSSELWIDGFSSELVLRF